MKKIYIILCMTLGSMPMMAQTNSLDQNKPGTTILNSTSNNSMSGVNPNGNPGTIIYNSSNSNAVNNTLITPNTPVTTTIISTPNNSPIVTRDNNIIPAGNPTTIITTTTAINPNVSSKTAVKTTIEEPVSVEQPVTIGNEISPTTVVQVRGNTLNGLSKNNVSPVLVNYIPEIIVTKLKNRYSDNLYDITMLKKSGNRSLYIVRVKGNTGYITYYLDEEGNVIP